MSELARAPLEELATRFATALERGGFEDCCTPDVHYEDPLALEPLTGPAALDDHAASLRRALPDLRVERTAPALGDGSHACVPWRASGTHTGELGMLPATERPLSLHGVHYLELADGAVRRARGFFDLYEAATQIGLLPSRGGLGETALLLVRGFGVRRRPTG